jgi:hypothetical protein
MQTRAGALNTTRMKVVILRLLVGLVAAACALYIADYLALSIRARAKGQSSVVETITVYDATPLKNGQDEVFYDHPDAETCVDAIFPHLGYPACWRLRRNPIKLIE